MTYDHDHPSARAEQLERLLGLGREMREMMNLDVTDRFEIKALAFYKCTGHVAPGKDHSPASGPVDEDALRDEWRIWVREHGIVIDRILEAVEELT